jgi:hypothetical protein
MLIEEGIIGVYERSLGIAVRNEKVGEKRNLFAARRTTLRIYVPIFLAHALGPSFK